VGLIPVEASFPMSVQTGPGDHPASCTIGNGGQSGRSVAFNIHPPPRYEIYSKVSFFYNTYNTVFLIKV